jgi:iron(III) transport system substrate-binding protein
LFNKHPKLVILIFFACVIGWIVVSPKKKKLIVYCAHDAVYSEKVLRHFSNDTGIRVETRFDTEATKSLGLVELISKEAKHPRCDVFWNNELLGMLDLQAKGLLEPYQGPGFQRIPAPFKDPAGEWCGFAARMRVFILNNATVPAKMEAVDEILAAEDLSRVAIARPMFGTTLTHYSLLWSMLGAEGLQAWHADTRARGMVEAPGNGPVKNLVSKGICDVGYTDTDDYFMAQEEGAQVAMLPVRVGEEQKTICIPNTVAIIRGCKKRDEAEQLVDYLLSKQTELLLARSPARQIPLGPTGGEVLPPAVTELMEFAKDSADLGDLLQARNEVLAWLKTL